MACRDPRGSCRTPVAAIIVQAIGTFFLAWLDGVTAAGNAFATIILTTLALIALMAAGGLFTNKSPYAITTETAYVMVAFVIIVQGNF